MAIKIWHRHLSFKHHQVRLLAAFTHRHHQIMWLTSDPHHQVTAPGLDILFILRAQRSIHDLTCLYYSLCVSYHCAKQCLEHLYVLFVMYSPCNKRFNMCMFCQKSLYWCAIKRFNITNIYQYGLYFSSPYNHKKFNTRTKLYSLTTYRDGQKKNLSILHTTYSISLVFPYT